jgi:hypothetical protein
MESQFLSKFDYNDIDIYYRSPFKTQQEYHDPINTYIVYNITKNHHIPFNDAIKIVKVIQKKIPNIRFLLHGNETNLSSKTISPSKNILCYISG